MFRGVYIDKSNSGTRGHCGACGAGWSHGQGTDRGELTMKQMQGGEQSTEHYQAHLTYRVSGMGPKAQVQVWETGLDINTMYNSMIELGSNVYFEEICSCTNHDNTGDDMDAS
jgi:hypothetical protein